MLGSIHAGYWPSRVEKIVSSFFVASVTFKLFNTVPTSRLAARTQYYLESGPLRFGKIEWELELEYRCGMYFKVM